MGGCSSQAEHRHSAKLEPKNATLDSFYYKTILVLNIGGGLPLHNQPLCARGQALTL